MIDFARLHWDTYSFKSEEIPNVLKTLSQLLAERGLDIRDSAQLKKGLEQLFHIEYYNMPDFTKQNYIITSNHISDFDALILGLLADNIKILAKNEWVENRELMSIAGLHYDLVGIDRDSKTNQAKALLQLIKHLHGKTPTRHIVIFPQGTISDINKNSVDRIQLGIFSLSTRTKTPILPIYIEQPNFYHPTRIVFGKPMAIPEKKQDYRELWQREIIALQDSLTPPARVPSLTQKHANNNKKGELFF